MIAIEFAEWILNSGYGPILIGNNESAWSHARIGSTPLTTIQLYSLFLEQRKSHEHTTTDTSKHKEMQKTPKG